MKTVMKGILTLAALTFSLLLSAPAMATTVTIGAPGDPGNGNAFPFGGAIPPNPGTRYQQVYNSSLFPGLMTINEISFFNTQYMPGQAVIDTATYEIHLSTTPNSVNGLDTVNFDDNVGADDQLFFYGLLGGPIGGTKFTIAGDEFSYDPTEGNLLLDIFISDSLADGNAFLDARNGTFGDDSSRAHDFGTQFEEWGLVTEFSDAQNSVVPEPSTFLLLGAGLMGAGLLRRKIRR